jgi:predicted O-linked N-acetylglucosamine transferase (SPINDLY family)
MQQALALYQAGNFSSAKRVCAEGLRLNPKHPDALHLYGLCLLYLKQPREALTHLKSSAKLAPKSSVLVNLSNVYRELGQLDRALENVLAAADADPHNGTILSNLSALYIELGFFEEAQYTATRAIALNPNDAGARVNLSNSLFYLRDFSAAEEAAKIAIALQPDSADGHFANANALKAQKRFHEAAEYYKRALSESRLRERSLAALGDLYRDTKKYLKAIGFYEDSLKLAPESRYVLGKFLFTKLLAADFDGLDMYLRRLESALQDEKQVVTPFQMLVLSDRADFQLSVANYWSKQNRFVQPMKNVLAKRRPQRVRLGYFSSDLRTHPVGMLLSGVLKYHDKEQFEVICFSFNSCSEDQVFLKIAELSDRVIRVDRASDREVAAIARDTDLDIALNLNGYTDGARTGIFELRVAPIQINYLGYPGTLGGSAHDYIVADEIIIPRKLENFYAEKVLRLDSGYLPFYADIADRPKRVDSPSLQNSPRVVRLCCFCNQYKITRDQIRLWAEILKSSPAELTLLSRGTEIDERVVNYFKHFGSLSSQLKFVGRTESQAEYLHRLSTFDLFLDTYPYNGHTTVKEALWAGLPVLTLQGQSFASRVASSILETAGLRELVAATASEYVEKARMLITDKMLLEDLGNRVSLSAGIVKLFDSRYYVKALEKALISTIDAES